MPQFVTYEWLKQRVKAMTGSEELNSAHAFYMGGVSKVVASLASYPAQVVKTRIQQRHVEPQAQPRSAAVDQPVPAPDFIAHTTRRYRGVVDCITQTWRHEGVYGFYRGCLTNSLRVAPSAAITFATYEWVAKAIAALRGRQGSASTG